jgi:hypothetical protein
MALKEYKALHPDIRDEDIRVDLAPPSLPATMRIRRAPRRGRRLTPPPAYDEIAFVPNADVPIARHVAADLLPALAAPQLNPEHHDAHGLPDSPQLYRTPLPEVGPERDGPAKDLTNISPQLNPPLRASPQPSNPFQVLPSAHTPWLLRPLPLPQPLPQSRPLPRPPSLLPHPPPQ